ncbi:MAG: DUF364 domain-containing protein [Pseudomonadota bacterium]
MDKTLQTGAIAVRLYDCLRNGAAMRIVADVCIGSTYIAVRLDDDSLGLAAVPTTDIPAGCPGFPPPGTLSGVGAASILAWLIEKDNPRQKALALAMANALIRQDRCDANGDALDLIKLTPADQVVMVGRFTPLIERIESTGAALTILEKDAAKGPFLTKGERLEALKNATVALITATTLLYDSLEEILAGLGRPRHVVLLGPSTPMLPDIFIDTPIHHLGGVRMIDPASILLVAATGGGTRAMRPYLETTNLFIKKPLPSP